MSDKRHVHRVALNIQGQLGHGDIFVPVIIEDVSFKGLRLRAEEAEIDALPFDSHEPYHIVFLTDEQQPLLDAWLEQLYRQTDARKSTIAIGCKVHHIELENLAVLRRLIELNSGDSDMTAHDLDALVDAFYDTASNASDN